MESKKSTKKTKKPKPKKPHYVNSKEFTQDIQDYYGSGTDEIGEKLGESIFKIAKGLSYAPNFINYSYKDDMVGDAIVKMFSALQSKKFNLETGNNPFSYFTTIAFHAFINRIKKEKKQRQVVSDYQEMVYEELASEYKLASQQSSDSIENDS
jgi:DNA-directed RNA polymerase specialized sigma24 family protein